MMAPREKSELERKRRSRNLVLLALLLGFVAVVYIVTLVRMGGN